MDEMYRFLFKNMKVSNLIDASLRSAFIAKRFTIHNRITTNIGMKIELSDVISQFLPDLRTFSMSSSTEYAERAGKMYSEIKEITRLI